MSGRLRVAIYTGNYNFVIDGVSRTLHRTVSFLERRGHAVLVFGSRPGKNPVPAPGTFVPVPSFAVPGRSEYRLNCGFGSVARARTEAFAPDLLHIATPDLLGLGALKYGRSHGIPVVASFHTNFTAYLAYYRSRWLEPVTWAYLRRFYTRCDQVYVPSLSMIETLRGRNFGDNLRLWGRGVDAELFHPGHRSAAWRAEHGIGDQEVVVLFVSRLVREKGLDVLAATLEGLEGRGIPHRSVVVGAGPESPRLRKRLEHTVFTGHLEGEALATAYASADVFVFPSATETFGNVTLEALASGLPAVCVAAPGSSSLVEDGVNGFLAGPEELADRVERLVRDPALRASMGSAARVRAEDMSWDEALTHLEGFYREVLAGQRSPAGGRADPA